jgi:RHS repeat-associated protein
LGQRTSFVLDVLGRQIGTINALNFRSTVVFDVVGRMQASVDALGNRTSNVFDAASRPIGGINALGNRVTSILDSAGRKIASQDALAHRTSLVYDVADRPIAVVSPLLNRSTSIFDEADKRIASVNAVLNRTSFGFDSAGQQIKLKDGNNNITTSIFDAAGRGIATLNALGNRTTQVLDAANQRIALIDARNNRTSFSFDNDGRQIQMLDPLLRRLTYRWDNASRQTLRLDAKLQRSTYIYDSAGRPTGRFYSDGTRVTQVFDAVGQRIVLSDSTGRTTSVFDGAGRTNSVTNPANKRLSYLWDAIGQRKRLTDPDGGLTSYTFDSASRITKLKNPWNEITSFQYDNASRRTVQLLANGTRASYLYDNADQLKRLANIKSDGTTISSFDYALDGEGNRTRVLEANGDRVTWLYDKTNQLLREIRSGANSYAITHVFDIVGNQTLKIDSGARTTSTFDAANQIINQIDNTGRTTFTFDANGNQSVTLTPIATRTTTTWDIDNRQTKAFLPSGVRNTSLYNGDGQRVQREDSSGMAKLIWDQQYILQETNLGGGTIAQVIVESPSYGNLISQRQGNNSLFHHFDGLGSTDRLTNSSAVVTVIYGYQAFGYLYFVNGAATNPYCFVGQLLYYREIDTGLLLLGARYYVPLLQVFSSADPQFGTQIHVYRYASNSPLNRVDPLGLDDFQIKDGDQTPLAGKNGAFFWGRVWELNQPSNAEKGGVIVQLVRWNVSEVRLGKDAKSAPRGFPGDDERTYFELWYILPKQTKIGATQREMAVPPDEGAFALINAALPGGARIPAVAVNDVGAWIPWNQRMGEKQPNEKLVYSGKMVIAFEARYFDCLKDEDLHALLIPGKVGVPGKGFTRGGAKLAKNLYSMKVDEDEIDGVWKVVRQKQGKGASESSALKKTLTANLEGKDSITDVTIK